MTSTWVLLAYALGRKQITKYTKKKWGAKEVQYKYINK